MLVFSEVHIIQNLLYTTVSDSDKILSDYWSFYGGQGEKEWFYVFSSIRNWWQQLCYPARTWIAAHVY